jgi:hypothetical protein
MSVSELGKPELREVGAARQAVVEVVAVVGAVHLVVADHVVAAALVEGDALRPARVLIIPGDGVVARVVHLVALDHHALVPRRGAAVGAGIRGLAVVADLYLPPVDVGQRLRLAAPAADVVVLDHHVEGAGGQADSVVLGAFSVRPV